MRILTFTSLFPSPADTTLGIFIHQRMRHVACHSQNTVCVVAPVPYFPAWLPSTRWRAISRIPKIEVTDGITVYHPRYLLLPKVSMYFHGLLIFLGCFLLLRKLHRKIRFDCIDAHYVYPDGFAAVLAGKLLRLPVVVSARGSDINVLSKFRVVRPMVRWTLRNSTRNIAVSRALLDEMMRLGAPPEKIAVIGNGVDEKRFRPLERAEARQALGMPAKAQVVIAVGALAPVKNHEMLIEAASRVVQRYPDLRIYIIGEGNQRKHLEDLASRSGLEGCISFPGKRPNEELNLWYSAANVTCLPSRKEGWPNVVLESLACGTPVVATNAGAVPEILTSPELGIVVEQDSMAMAEGLCQALGRTWDRQQITRYALTRTWESVAQEVETYLQGAIDDASS
jgi:glycosyltransferase involved in cell wall biosynthesis